MQPLLPLKMPLKTTLTTSLLAHSSAARCAETRATKTSRETTNLTRATTPSDDEARSPDGHYWYRARPGHRRAPLVHEQPILLHGAATLKPFPSITTTTNPAMIAKATPALNTVRGFQNTPVTSGDEDSDYGVCATPPLSAKRSGRAALIDDVVSANCSPNMRGASSPAVSGIAKLRLQMEPLSLDNSSRTSTLTLNGSNGHGGLSKGLGISTRMVTGSTSYEVNLEHDYVDESGSKDVQRKMTADDFDPLRCLGKGTYGTVLLVKQRNTGRLYAQKQFKKASLTVHKKLIEQTKTERQILESVNRHPFVVKLYYAFQDHEKLYLILEYGQGGELFTHLSTEKMFAEPVAAFYMAEMLLAISHLHSTLGVVYRDLKPENCLLDAEGHLLLTDFGLSKVAVDTSEDHCNSMLGTVEYMAPEVIQGQKYGKAVDWWSFGALGYDLMTGNPPFRGGNHAKIQQNIVKQKLVMPYFLSPDAKDLLTRLLKKDPKKRLGANMPKDLQIMKGHRFFRKIDWKKLEAREVEPPIQPMITDPELAENFAPEFTDLSLSPVITAKDPWSAMSAKEDDPFGGFSFSHAFRFTTETKEYREIWESLIYGVIEEKQTLHRPVRFVLLLVFFSGAHHYIVTIIHASFFLVDFFLSCPCFSPPLLQILSATGAYRAKLQFALQSSGWDLVLALFLDSVVDRARVRASERLLGKFTDLKRGGGGKVCIQNSFKPGLGPRALGPSWRQSEHFQDQDAGGISRDIDQKVEESLKDAEKGKKDGITPGSLLEAGLDMGYKLVASRYLAYLAPGGFSLKDRFAQMISSKQRKTECSGVQNAAPRHRIAGLENLEHVVDAFWGIFLTTGLHNEGSPMLMISISDVSLCNVFCQSRRLRKDPWLHLLAIRLNLADKKYYQGRAVLTTLGLWKNRARLDRTWLNGKCFAPNEAWTQLAVTWAGIWRYAVDRRNYRTPGRHIEQKVLTQRRNKVSKLLLTQHVVEVSGTTHIRRGMIVAPSPKLSVATVGQPGKREQKPPMGKVKPRTRPHNGNGCPQVDMIRISLAAMAKLAAVALGKKLASRNELPSWFRVLGASTMPLLKLLGHSFFAKVYVQLILGGVNAIPAKSSLSSPRSHWDAFGLAMWLKPAFGFYTGNPHVRFDDFLNLNTRPSLAVDGIQVSRAAPHPNDTTSNRPKFRIERHRYLSQGTAGTGNCLLNLILCSSKSGRIARLKIKSFRVWQGAW
ncbi:hypothetical protein CCUS01_17158 [Colletotrichum cuscutae]|uniref:Serine/threonine-protein kinase psk1 n=1 Tax=Colletotrichum cuscutae TaxID=1209917 RepID=A0AAI9Y517_9PEZI|nr:hypothetical protein CCUS01_17158 [Colletotrichum cuscutae]